MDWIRQGNAVVEGDTIAITISKKDLQEIRDHYIAIADEIDDADWMWGFYLGKADVLIEMLKAFDNKEGRVL